MSRDVSGDLVAALQALGGPGCRADVIASRPWASATFEGARHRLAVRLPGNAADMFLAKIEEADVPLRGHFLADLAIVDRAPDGDGMWIEIEALTIKEA